MIKHFTALIKKDLQLMISGKFFLLSLSSLIIYSCYICFFYANTDVAPYKMYLYNETSTTANNIKNTIPTGSYNELEYKLKQDKDALGIYMKSDSYCILQYDNGSNRLNSFKYRYAQQIMESNLEDSTVSIINAISHPDKLRREMSCEVLFFEIVAIGFLGIAALLFKEKSYGTIKVQSILPCHNSLFIASKIAAFLINDILFSILLIIINLFSYSYEPIKILLPVIIQIMILSALMTLVGFYCALIFDNIKQFTFAYLFISLCMITPVFLAANTSLNWPWMNYYPIYHLYINIKNAFWGNYSSIQYYIICILLLITIFAIDYKKFKTMISKE